MRASHTFLALSVLSVLPLGAAIAKDAGLAGIISIAGSCKQLQVASTDRSEDCTGKVLNFTYTDGRSGFYFLTGQGAVVTFSTQGAKEVHPDDDTAVAPIDFVLFGKAKDTPQKIKAVGFCRYHNPHNGPVPIDCLAYTSLGPFSASFMTDGKEDSIKNIE